MVEIPQKWDNFGDGGSNFALPTSQKPPLDAAHLQLLPTSFQAFHLRN
jgi:hypothetical protein